MKRFAFLLSLILLSSALQAQKAYTIYPVPQAQFLSEGTASISSQVTVVAGAGIDDVTLNRAVEILESSGLKVLQSSKASKSNSNLYLGVNSSSDAADKLVGRLKLDRKVFSLPKYDRHILSLNAGKSGSADIVILGENTNAVFCGLASLEQMVENGTRNMQCVTLYDYADIKYRGVIEGYYGVPYSAEVTKDIFRFMARYKMNAYMYGAKSDPYHSRFWSEPYPEAITADQQRIGYLSQSMIRDITDVAHATKVDFIWAIHPGTAFTNPESKDVNDRIMTKFEDMYKLGVRQFGVFVDDVGVPTDDASLKLGADRLSNLQNRIDQRWNNSGAAPADTVKPLHYVPQLYAYSWVERNVAKRFFESLSNTPSKVNIYITGRAVWTVPNNEDLKLIADFLGRPVSWWWNYPCNDNDMTKIFPMDVYSNFKDEEHIDNLARLEKLEDVNSIIINPMQQGELSKITLFSVADYTWNNAAFNNDLSWAASIPAVVGKDMAPSLRYLAAYLRYFDADALNYQVNRYKSSCEDENPRPGGLIGRLTKVIEACEKIQTMENSESLSDRLFYADIRPWLLRLKAMSSETIALLKGEDVVPVDYDHTPEFQYEVLNGMGEDINLSLRVAEPSSEILMPFISWLREQK